MNLTIETLKKIYPSSTLSNRLKYVDFLNTYIDQYEINTPIRKQMFLAQIGHESGQLRYCEEIASGEAYEGRKDLGNIQEGDGRRFKGRGFIQITGRSNYGTISRAFGLDFITNPELLSTPEWAVKSACWWWKTNNLNYIADSGDFKRVTRKINGGYNGLEDRLKLYELCKKYIE
jgi:putative chitinase